jgi:serine/threonine-protein kinase RsbW
MGRTAARAERRVRPQPRHDPPSQQKPTGVSRAYPGSGMTDARRVRVRLSAAPNAELRAAQAVEEIGAGLGISRDTLDEVKLAVVEACLNALEYGGTDVEVVVVAHPGEPPWIEADVTDHGPGFDPDAIVAPRIENKLHAPRKRGWGLELIRKLMDRVEIESRPGLTRVHMVRGR